ncbi:hypothetical protein TRFO_07025 [Tritrichomonas foetus]|uniref:mitogen-activated protein kinase kinase n=1 Tax=Tritrichomonas foetus TaxID=1144522 RepID=A0A1J4JYK4_9EUKA|nr:hypothetical protein TRFO_07025 [Tritrichomonas foetus]|eukprot:OHT02612.1 hypothetical protein TRFO_07025 [Tritrichomonas foetus]
MNSQQATDSFIVIFKGKPPVSLFEQFLKFIGYQHLIPFGFFDKEIVFISLQITKLGEQIKNDIECFLTEKSIRDVFIDQIIPITQKSCTIFPHRLFFCQIPACLQNEDCFELLIHQFTTDVAIIRHHEGCIYEIQSDDKQTLSLISTFVPEIPYKVKIKCSDDIFQLPIAHFYNIPNFLSKAEFDYVLNQNLSNDFMRDIKCNFYDRNKGIVILVCESKNEVSLVIDKFNFACFNDTPIGVVPFADPKTLEKIKQYEISVPTNHNYPKDFYQEVSFFGPVYQVFVEENENNDFVNDYGSDMKNCTGSIFFQKQSTASHFISYTSGARYVKKFFEQYIFNVPFSTDTKEIIQYFRNEINLKIRNINLVNHNDSSTLKIYQVIFDTTNPKSKTESKSNFKELDSTNNDLSSQNLNRLLKEHPFKNAIMFASPTDICRDDLDQLYYDIESQGKTLEIMKYTFPDLRRVFQLFKQYGNISLLRVVKSTRNYSLKVTYSTVEEYNFAKESKSSVHSTSIPNYEFHRKSNRKLYDTQYQYILTTEQFNKFQKESDIGGGSFGTVELVSDADILFAMKTINITSNMSKDSIIDEFLLTLESKHPCIVEVYGFYPQKDKISILMEPLDTSLKEALLSKDVPNDNLAMYIIDIILGLRYIHSLSIIHRDIKPENILIEEETGHAKICDFGLSRKVDSDSITLSMKCGTIHYMAPEIMDYQQYYNSSVDVYSFCVTLFHLMHGRLPNTTLKQLVKGEIEKADESLPIFIQKIINEGRNFDPKKRLTIDQILQILLENKLQIFPDIDTKPLYKRVDEVLKYETALNKRGE